MFGIFKLRTELIGAQYDEILALKNLVSEQKNLINILKEEARLLQKIQDVDRDEILRLHTEVAALKFKPYIGG